MPEPTQHHDLQSAAEATGPLGSCIVCGHMGPLVVWWDGTTDGACGECRDRVAGWDALEAENDKLRKHIATLVERVNRQRDRINRVYAALDKEGDDADGA